MCGRMKVFTLVLLAVLLSKGTSHPVKENEKQFDSFLATLSSDCPPGFVHHGNSCACANWSMGMVVCDVDSQKASMMIGYCMTYINKTGELRAGACAQSYSRNNSYKFYYPLPSSAADLNEDMCGPWNSKGLLCSECQDGFAASALLSTKCVNCTGSGYGWLKALAAVYVPNTVILIAVVVLSFSVVSGPTNAFIFFSQVTTTYVDIVFVEFVLQAQGRTAYSSKPVLVIGTIYEFFNLNFLPYVIPPFCLTEHLTRLQGIALEYAIAIYPLFLVVILYVCIELHARNFRPLVWCWKPFHRCFACCRRTIDRKTSVIDAFATFMTLSYVKLLDTTTYLLLNGHIYNGEGRKVSTAMYYDTNVEYFYGKHLPFALIAIFVFMTFIAIPPLVLLLYQCSCFQRCLTRCRMNTLALRTFVEIFHGPYKCGVTTGTYDYRCFAGLYFVLRIIVFLISFAGLLTYVIGSALLYSFIAILFALLQPYRKHIHNIIDAVIFAIMSALYVLIASHVIFILIVGNPSTLFFTLTDLLYSLPLVYLIIFIIFWLLDKKTNCTRRLKQNKFLRCFFEDRTEAQIAEEYDALIPHRLLHPRDYDQFSASEDEHNSDAISPDNITYGIL